jgi:hypothetical protein
MWLFLSGERVMRFGIVRLLIAVTAFASAFAWTRQFGTDGLAVGMFIGAPIAGVVLIINRSDSQRLCTSLIAAGLGLLASTLIPNVRPHRLSPATSIAP